MLHFRVSQIKDGCFNFPIFARETLLLMEVCKFCFTSGAKNLVCVFVCACVCARVRACVVVHIVLLGVGQLTRKYFSLVDILSL